MGRQEANRIRSSSEATCHPAAAPRNHFHCPLSATLPSHRHRRCRMLRPHLALWSFRMLTWLTIARNPCSRSLPRLSPNVRRLPAGTPGPNSSSMFLARMFPTFISEYMSWSLPTFSNSQLLERRATAFTSWSSHNKTVALPDMPAPAPTSAHPLVLTCKRPISSPAEWNQHDGPG